LVEPCEVRFVVGNPFLDRLPWRFDRLEGRDVEGRPGRRRDVDDACGIDAVVTDGMLGLGRDVVDDGGEEISGLEDLEITFGGVVAL